MALLKKRPGEDDGDEAIEAESSVATDDPEPDLARSEATDADTDVGAPPAPPDDADALLSLFGSEDHRAKDREALLTLAGEVELADLVDELQTVSAALNVVRREAG